MGPLHGAWDWIPRARSHREKLFHLRKPSLVSDAATMLPQHSIRRGRHRGFPGCREKELNSTPRGNGSVLEEWVGPEIVLWQKENAWLGQVSEPLRTCFLIGKSESCKLTHVVVTRIKMATSEQSAWHTVSAEEILVALNTWGQCAYSGQAWGDDEEEGERGQEVTG